MTLGLLNHPVPVSMPEPEFKKAVEAVHIVPRKGKLTLVMRKMFNVLIYHAVEQVRRRREKPGGWFEIHITDLARLLGYNSRDYGLLKNSLRELNACQVEWNVLGDGGRKWGVSSLVPFVEIQQGSTDEEITNSCVLRFSFGEADKFTYKTLLNPEVYARINLKIQSLFRSSYSLALYENCIRYRGVSRTGRKSVRMWRELICGQEAGVYPEFKEFNRSVLQRALAEINSNPELVVELEMVVYRRGRTVEDLEFLIREKRQGSLALDTSTPMLDEKIVARLAKLGFTRSEVDELLIRYEQDYLLGNLDYVEERGAKQQQLGKIESMKGYFISALKRDFRDDNVKRLGPKKQPKKNDAAPDPLAAIERDFEAFRTKRAREVFDALREQEQQAVVDRFLETNQSNEYLLAEFRKTKLKKPIVANTFFAWLKIQPGVLTKAEETDKLSYAAFKGLLQSVSMAPA